VESSVREFDPGACDQVLDRLRDEHLPRGSVRSDTRACMNGDSPDRIAGQFDLARVQPGSNL
jgi:hypothetical protein